MVGGGGAAADGRRMLAAAFCIRYWTIQCSSLYYYYIFAITHYHIDDWTVFNSKWLQIATVAVTRSVPLEVVFAIWLETSYFLFVLCSSNVYSYLCITTTYVYAVEYSRSILSEL